MPLWFQWEIHKMKKTEPRHLHQHLTEMFLGWSTLKRLKTHQKLIVIFCSDILMQKVALTHSPKIKSQKYIMSSMIWRKAVNQERLWNTPWWNSPSRDIIICWIIHETTQKEKNMFPLPLLFLSISFQGVHT